jgi:hypothetical protein
MSERVELNGRVSFVAYKTTKGGAPYIRVGVTTEERTVYASVWSNERYWELGPVLRKGTPVEVAGVLEGENLKVEAGSWKVG